MYCRNCGNEVDDKAVACMKCGVAPLNGKKFCQNCGKETNEQAIVCVSCGVSVARKSSAGTGQNDKLAAGLCGILLGSIGVHKFILGYNKEGLIMLLISVLSLFTLSVIPGIIGLIEGIIYLTKSDEEFDQTYIQNKKGWF